MKNLDLFRNMALSFLVLAIASCNKPEPDDNGKIEKDEPSFPSLVENYSVMPGEVLEIEFTPNYDWEVSIPSEIRQWFWIKDGSFTVTRIRGYASESPVRIEVCVTDTDEFDKNFSCEVTMTMDGESKVVAKYMLPAKERTLSLYAAEREADGSLKKGEDGESYVYGMVESSSVELMWSATDADFRAPVQVEANCQWQVELPEWLDTNVPETTAGVIELVFTGVSLEDASGTVVFKAGEEILKEIAVSVPSCKDFKIYSASIKDGELEYGSDGSYKWSEESVDGVTLVWLGSDFRMPVKIDSKCNWTIEVPEWMEVEVPENTAGVVILTLKGKPAEYPLEDTDGNVVFKLDDVAVHEMAVSIPGCREIMTYFIPMGLTELDFNYIGQIKTPSGYIDGPVNASIFGTSQADVFAVEFVDGKYELNASDDPDWINITISAFDIADNADVLQNRDVAISVEENAGDERSAMLFFMPYDFSGKLSNLFNDDKTELKEEFKAFAIPVKQYSNDTEYLIPLSTETAMAQAGATFASASDEKRTELASVFGETKYVYTLAYDNIYARDEAFLTMARPFTSVKVYDQDRNDKSDDPSFWLTYTNGGDANAYGVIDMYLGEDMILPEISSVGYVVFYDSMGNVLAVVECTSPEAEEVVTPPEEEPGDGTVTDEYGNVFVAADEYLADPSAAEEAGATMYKVTSGPYYDQYKEVGCPILMLEYTSVDTELELTVPSPVSWFQVMPYIYSDYVSVNDMLISETSGIMEASVTEVKVKMMQGVASEKTMIEKNNGVKLLLHKDMITQDPTLVVFCRLNVSE